ncbi:Phosphatidate cytidylyltransferase [hydrothermal vent metagenome]|uniref:Phosphatidate cytidylyltransferase n=1 Tax=hydrothermal vent metagenome TaxID=652676 RepID=A0A3B0YZ96_9ZZZZ
MIIPSHSLYAMIIVIILLTVATIITYSKVRNNPDKDFTELQQRVNSWWWIIGLLFVFLSVSANSAIVFFAFLSFLALKEFVSIIPTRHADRNVLFWLYISIPFQYYWVATQWYGMFIIFIPVYLFLFIPMRMVLIGATDGFIKAAGVLHWVAMLTVFSVSHIAYLVVLEDKNANAGAVGSVLFLILMTQSNDICQYIWGKMLGKRKIIPKVSPNKTWAGFIGGVLSITLLSALVGPLLTALDTVQSIGAGLIISIGGFVGDVVISSVKRDLSIKDSGSLLPGHGGILDRMDSLLYTAPLFFHYLYYLKY